MRSRKVFKIYSALSDADRQLFGHFLDSPYFGYNPRLSRFRTILENQLIQKPTQDLDCKTVWFMAVGTESYRPNGFDKYCAELLAALNEFIAMENIRSRPLHMAKHQMAGYRQMSLNEWVTPTYEALIEKHKEAFELDPEGLQVQYSILYTYGEFLTQQPRTPWGKHFIALDEVLNNYFIACKAELVAAVENYTIVYKDPIELTHIDFLKNELSVEAEKLPVVTRLINLSWQLRSDKSDTAYFQLKEELGKISDRLPKDVREPLYKQLYNYISVQVRFRPSLLPEVNDIGLIALSNEVFIERGKLLTGAFVNLIETGLRLGNLAWAEEFSREWNGKLTDSESEMASFYIQASIDFYRGKYADCIKSMEVVLRDFKQDIFFSKDARIYCLMAVFEMSKTEENSIEMESRLNAFRVFLSREKMIGQLSKEAAENFVKLYRRLVTYYSLPESQRKSKAPKMLQTIQSLKPIIQFEWLEAQVKPYL